MADREKRMRSFLVRLEKQLIMVGLKQEKQYRRSRVNNLLKI